MRQYSFILFLLILLLATCAGQKGNVIFFPEPADNDLSENVHESWQVIASQNGLGDEEIPTWVHLHLTEDINGIESLDMFSGKYVFIGENNGNIFSALQQWASNFTIVQDLPRVIVTRVERRLITSATLYPDDEYGEYFALMIKKVSEGEYPEAVKEQTFWIKKKRIHIDGEDVETPGTDSEQYVFLVLINMDKSVLQKKIREIMEGIKTTASPTRDQAAAIKNINQTFFEGF